MRLIDLAGMMTLVHVVLLIVVTVILIKVLT